MADDGGAWTLIVPPAATEEEIVTTVDYGGEPTSVGEVEIVETQEPELVEYVVPQGSGGYIEGAVDTTYGHGQSSVYPVGAGGLEDGRRFSGGAGSGAGAAGGYPPHQRHISYNADENYDLYTVDPDDYDWQPGKKGRPPGSGKLSSSKGRGRTPQRPRTMPMSIRQQYEMDMAEPEEQDEDINDTDLDMDSEWLMGLQGEVGLHDAGDMLGGEFVEQKPPKEPKPPRKPRVPKPPKRKRKVGKKREEKPRLQWKDKDMIKAMKACLEKGMGIKASSMKYNVPFSTLKDRVRGRVVHGSRPGMRPLLSEDEEHQLRDFINEIQRVGFRIDRDDACVRAAEVAVLNNNLHIQRRLGPCWFHGFMKRHGIELERPEALPQSIPEAHYLVDNCLRKLEHLQKKAGLFAKSNRLYCTSQVTIDDAGLYTINNVPSDVTLIACGSASGHILPPFILFRGEHVKLTAVQAAYPEAYFTNSGPGIVDSYLFLTWFREHFLPNTEKVTKPLMLVIDAPGALISVQFLSHAQEARISLAALLPNTSSILNPLMISVLHPFQSELSAKANDWKVAHTSQPVTRAIFAELLQAAWNSGMTADNMRKGFKEAGVFPFQRRAPYATRSQLEKTFGFGSDGQAIPELQPRPAPLPKKRKGRRGRRRRRGYGTGYIARMPIFPLKRPRRPEPEPEPMDGYEDGEELDEYLDQPTVKSDDIAEQLEDEMGDRSALDDEDDENTTLSQMKEDLDIDAATSLTDENAPPSEELRYKRLIDVYPNLIGRKVKHCWQVSKRRKEWFTGTIIGFTPEGMEPEDDTEEGVENSPCLDVTYEGWPGDVYHMVLDNDWRKGELIVID